jgi:hypothetical protein
MITIIEQIYHIYVFGLWLPGDEFRLFVCVCMFRTEDILCLAHYYPHIHSGIFFSSLPSLYMYRVRVGWDKLERLDNIYATDVW